MDGGQESVADAAQAAALRARGRRILLGAALLTLLAALVLL
jgi:hypothetical protein